MSKKPIGRITRQEKNEIKALFFRSRSNKNLLMTLHDKDSFEFNENLFQKVTDENKLLNDKMQEWWSKKAFEYKWEGYSWYIDFNTNEIFVYE